MLTRKLGRTGLKVAALCLGGNTFGWTTDQPASEAVLDAYLDQGLTEIPGAVELQLAAESTAALDTASAWKDVS